MPVRSEARGFTLLEVLVATAIFAVAALGLLTAQRNQIRTDQHLDTKTFAHWVALNHLADLRLNRVFPELGEVRSEVSMAGRDWQVVTRAQPTPVYNVRLLVIGVAEKPREFGAEAAEPVTQVTGFIAQETSDATP